MQISVPVIVRCRISTGSAFCYRPAARGERLATPCNPPCGIAGLVPESARDLFSEAETLYAPDLIVQCLVTGTFSMAYATQIATHKGEVPGSIFEKSS